MPVEALPIWRAHPAEDVLENYSLGRVSEPVLSCVEEHLLVCPHCCDALQDLDDFTAAMRDGLAQFADNRLAQTWYAKRTKRRVAPQWLSAKWLNRHPMTPRNLRLVTAALAIAVFAAVYGFVGNRSPASAGPTAVHLVALRGARAEGLIDVPVGHPLDLITDVTDLHGSPQEFSLRMVNASGRDVWHGSAAPSGSGVLTVRVSKELSPGVYWVRLYRGSERSLILREFGIRVQQLALRVNP